MSASRKAEDQAVSWVTWTHLFTIYLSTPVAVVTAPPASGRHLFLYANNVNY